jgi:hypothetical protein
VAAFAQVLSHLGLLHALQEQVRFARFGHYDTIDFLLVLIGYAQSLEQTLKAYYARLEPFAETFMALFGRSRLPDRSTLSRFLAALHPRNCGGAVYPLSRRSGGADAFRLSRRFVGSPGKLVVDRRC